MLLVLYYKQVQLKYKVAFVPAILNVVSEGKQKQIRKGILAYTASLHCSWSDLSFFSCLQIHNQYCIFRHHYPRYWKKIIHSFQLKDPVHMWHKEQSLCLEILQFKATFHTRVYFPVVGRVQLQKKGTGSRFPLYSSFYSSRHVYLNMHVPFLHIKPPWFNSFYLCLRTADLGKDQIL